MKKVFRLLSLALAASAVNAENPRCDSCTIVGYKQTAISAGAGIHYVVDIPYAIVKKFDVDTPPGEYPIPPLFRLSKTSST